MGRHGEVHSLTRRPMLRFDPSALILSHHASGPLHASVDALIADALIGARLHSPRLFARFTPPSGVTVSDAVATL